MWQKREGEWERERQARQRLMAEVLESRQAQIGEKLDELREQQEESLQVCVVEKNVYIYHISIDFHKTSCK